MAIKRPKGTNDLLPNTDSYLLSVKAHDWLIRQAKIVLERAGAERIDTPIFEEADLVKRSAGDSSDIVRKEMFVVHYFGNHGGYVLRPEGTAGIMRAYIENGLKQLPVPAKLWTSGPMFRAERHQKGRYRQFNQVDYEAIGSAEPLVDAEAIALMLDVVQQLGISKVSIKLGSVGDMADRAAYNAYLRELFTAVHDELSVESQDRLIRNPMRILDSKSEGDQAIIARLKPRPMLDFLGPQAKEHFEAVQQFLRAWEIPFEIDPSIVRGLDYYNKTAWELHHEGSGAKTALGGGGRYDGLSQQLGSKEIPAIGWALGVERLLLALQEEQVSLPDEKNLVLYLAALDQEQLGFIAQIGRDLRQFGRVEFAYRTMKVKAALSEAERRGAQWIGLIGSQEMESGTINLKNLKTGEQKAYSRTELEQLFQ